MRYSIVQVASVNERDKWPYLKLFRKTVNEVNLSIIHPHSLLIISTIQLYTLPDIYTLYTLPDNNTQFEIVSEFVSQ